MTRRRRHNPRVDVPAWLLGAGLIAGLYAVAKNQTSLFAGITLPWVATPPAKLCYPPSGVTGIPIAPTNGACPLGWVGPQ